MAKKNTGKITIEPGTNVLPHEMATAKALMEAGFSVKFKKKKEGYKIPSADVVMGGKVWEIKAPKGSKLDAVERNLRRAKEQSEYVILDSFRFKKIPDNAIKREILAKAPYISKIREVIFVNRKREVIDIYKKKQ